MAFSFANIFSGIRGESATPTATVGIDIGSSSVKVVEIEQTDKALMLRTYGELQLGPYGGNPLGEVVQLDTVKQTEAIVDVLRESQVTTKHGALAMPLSSSFVTVVPITLGAEEDMGARIPVEAKKYIPLPLNDVTLNWNELAPIGEGTTGVREVMLAAIENKALGTYKELQRSIGMTSEPAEIEAFSLVRSLWRHEDTTLAIIDLGAKTSKLYIIRNGMLERIHRVASGGVQTTRRLSEMLSVSYEEAENIKRTATREDEHGTDVHRAMVSALQGPLQEFKRIIQLYESRIGGELHRVVFSGGVSASPFVIPYAQDVLSKQIEIGNPFSKVAYPAFMEDTLASIAPTFAVSLGAALRQFEYDT